MEWRFLNKALEVRGFSSDFRVLIGSCISLITYSLLLNENIYESFYLERGLQQGDPLSSFLSICCSEFLSRLLQREEEQGGLHGIKIARIAPAVSHLMYADDLLIMCRADPKEASIIKDSLQQLLQLVRPTSKSKKVEHPFSKSTTINFRKVIKDILGFKDIGSKAIYLGNTFVFERNKTNEFFNLKERIKNRMEG